jgi:transcriptional regulator with XRE-family HTH domain
MEMQQARASREFAHKAQVFGDSKGMAPAKEIDTFVGSRLRARRMELAMSQAALGRHLGLTFSQVQKYEKGSNRIGAGRLYQLSALLGVPLQYFFKGLVDSQPVLESKTPEAVAEDDAGLQEVLVRVPDPRARRALLALASSLADPN